MQVKRSQRKPLRRKAARARLVAVVQAIEEARAALRTARAAGMPVILVSPPGGAAYLGVGFFAALIEAARAEFPEVAVEAVMDCGEDPGWALSALRMGFKTVVLRGNPKARARVVAIARAMGARLLARAPRATGNRNFA